MLILFLLTGVSLRFSVLKSRVEVSQLHLLPRCVNEGNVACNLFYDDPDGGQKPKHIGLTINLFCIVSAASLSIQNKFTKFSPHYPIYPLLLSISWVVVCSSDKTTMVQMKRTRQLVQLHHYYCSS